MESTSEDICPSNLAELEGCLTIFDDSHVLKLKFQNCIFLSVYYCNFYYTECAFNYIDNKSKTYVIENEMVHYKYILRTLEMFYDSFFSGKNVCLSRTGKLELQLRKINDTTSFNKHRPIFNFILTYFRLMYDNYRLENMNGILLDKLQKLKNDHAIKNNKTENCMNCADYLNKLKIMDDKYNSLSNSHSMLQIDKDRIVMKYAKSEKKLIDSKRLIDATEKKIEITLRENLDIQKKFEKVHDKVRKLTEEIHTKCSEIVKLRNRIENFKIIENTKEMKLTWARNRLKFINSAAEEIKMKLKKSSEKMSNSASYYDICKPRNDKEIIVSPHMHGQIQLRKREIICNEHEKKYEAFVEDNTEYESNLINSGTSYTKSIEFLNETLKQENIEITNLEQELFFRNLLKSKEDRIQEFEFTVQQLNANIAELQIDLEMYRYREAQALEFVEKLTDKNIQLLNDNDKWQSKYVALEHNQIPLSESFDRLKIKIENMTSNLLFEKLKRSEENEILSKFVAEQSYFNEKLLKQVEDLKGQRIILSKKYDFILKEMVRKIHSCHSTTL